MIREQSQLDYDPTDKLEQWIREELPKQYKEQTDVLHNLGLLDLLYKTPEGAKGIVGIDKQEYPLPTIQDIEKNIRENKEMYKEKIEQFSNPDTKEAPKLLITPFALPLEVLVNKLKETLLKHHQENKLLATKVNSDDQDESLELDENQPVWFWDGWTEKNTVYFPKQLEKDNHDGKTKQEILTKQRENNSPFAGYLVSLTESNPNIPREGKGKTIKGRDQIEAGKTPNEYMGMLKNDSQYQQERPKTLEDWLTQISTRLEQKNEVIDDYSGNGSASYCPASFNPSSCCVGCAYWDRSVRRAFVNRRSPDYRCDNDGLSSAVGVDGLKFEN